MKNVTELKAALHMILARLDSTPKTSKEWEVITKHLEDATHFADALTDLCVELEGIMGEKRE